MDKARLLHVAPSSVAMSVSEYLEGGLGWPFQKVVVCVEALGIPQRDVLPDVCVCMCMLPLGSHGIRDDSSLALSPRLQTADCAVGVGPARPVRVARHYLPRASREADGRGRASPRDGGLLEASEGYHLQRLVVVLTRLHADDVHTRSIGVPAEFADV